MEFRVDFVVAIVSIVAGVVTIIWFIRDMRKENSKILKAILDTQKSSMDVLCKIEEGQRRGFEILAQMLLAQTKILERIESKLP